MDPDKTSIIEELERINASNEFHAKPVMQRMLSYLVTEYVEGRSDQIKGYSVGLDVFGQGSDFDPARSAVVRNNAVRLRNLLTTYYLGEGRNNPLRIDIPKGNYVPQVSRNRNNGSIVNGAATDIPQPAIAVLPFNDMANGQNLGYLADGFSHELSDALTKFDDLRVIGMTRRNNGDGYEVDAVEQGIGFLVDGEIQAQGTQIKVNCRLVNTADNSHLWGDSFRFDLEKDDLFDIQEKISGRIASLIGGEYGHVNQARHEAIMNSRARTLNERDVLLKQYHHANVLDDDSRSDFQEALFESLEQDPDSALLNAIAGGYYGHIWVGAYPGADEAREKFTELTERAYRLNPLNQWVLGSLAFKCLAFDERERFFKLLDEHGASLANSPLRLGAWAMYTCYFGEWERGRKLLDKVFENNVHLPLWFYGVTSLYYYRIHDYETALVEANKNRIPGLFWGPAYRVAALGQLGRLEEAEREFEALLECRPDFVETGRFLLGCFIKEPELLDHVFDGFAKIGVEIA